MDPMVTYAPKQPTPSEWLALASGLVFVALQVAGLIYFFSFFVPRQPPVDAPAALLAAFYAANRSTITTNNYLVVLTTLFLLLYVAGLFGVLRREEGGTGASAAAVLGSGVASAVITALGGTISELGAAKCGTRRSIGSMANEWSNPVRVCRPDYGGTGRKQRGRRRRCAPIGGDCEARGLCSIFGPRGPWVHGGRHLLGSRLG